jgi:RNA polymerase sigma factor (sigma-70 family)
VDRRRPVTLEEFEAHDRFVRDLARRLLAEDAHGAEDLAQDVWSAAIERPPPHRASLRGWLRAVTLALNTNRLRRRVPLYDAALDSRARGDAHSAEQVELAHQRRAVARAVHELREPYREAVILRFYESLPPRDVARKLGRPVETVNTQIKRGLAQIRLALQKDGESDEDVRTWLLLLAAPRKPRGLERLALPAACVAGVAGVVATLQLARPDPSELALAPAAQVETLADTSAELPRLGAREGEDDGARRELMEPEAPRSSASEPASSARKLSVTVADPEGRAIADATVLVRTAGGWDARAQVDERGAAEVELAESDFGNDSAPDGFVWIKAQAPGRATAEEAVIDLSERDSESVHLELAPGGASLRGRVLDLDSIPVPGARVLVLPASLPTGWTRDAATYRTARHETRTDDEGAFALEHLIRGPAQVFLEHPDLGIGRVETPLAAQNDDVELRFTPGCIVHGTVVNEHGVPLAGVRVSGIAPNQAALPAAWDATSTDAQGRYSLSMTADPRLELWAKIETSEELLASEIVDAAPGESVEWSPTVRRWLPVRVRIVDQDGAPVEGWLVTLYSERYGETRWNGALSDAEGLADVSLPCEGSLRLHVQGPFGDKTSTAVAALTGLSGSDEVVHEIVVEREPSAQCGLQVRIVARGFELPDGLLAVVEQANRINRMRIPLGPDGAVSADDLTPGGYTLLVVGPGALQRELATFEVAAGEVADLGQLELDPVGRLDLSRLAAEPMLEVWLEIEGKLPRRCWGGDGGSVEPLLLFEGRYTLVRDPLSAAPKNLVFEMRAGGLVSIAPDFSPL